MSDEKIYLFDELTLDLARGCLLRAGEPIHLRPQSYEVLKYLVSNKGRLVSKDQLIEEVWRGRVVTDDSLVQCLRDVRQALGGSSGQHIRNVRGRGYIFDPAAGDHHEGETGQVWKAIDPLNPREDDEEAAGNTAATMQAPSPPAAMTPRPSFGRVTDSTKAVTLSVASLLVITLAVGAAYYFFSPRPELPVATAAVRSLAVLPFKPLVRESHDEVLELGMADTLIARLSNSREIVVRPTGAVRRYGGLEQDPLAAGRALNVEAVLDGHIQQSGDRIRVSARLVSVDDGKQLWAGQFDEQMTDIFAVQDSISQRVAAALALKLSGEEQKRLSKRHTSNIRAYQSYLQGRYNVQRRTRENLLLGIGFYENAIKEDANYALAYAGLADAYSFLVSRAYIAPHEGRRKAREAAARALALDDNLAEAHSAIGQIHTFFAPYDFAVGDRELRRAIELNPNLTTAHEVLRNSLQEQGRLDEGLEEALKARELDPLSPTIGRNVAFSYLLRREYPRSLEHYRETKELGPLFVFGIEIEIYIQNGLLNEALLELEKAIRERPNEPLLTYSVGMVYAAQGKKIEALRIVKQLEQMSELGLGQAHWIARIYATLNDKDLALSWLERGLDAEVLGIFFKDAPVWDTIRTDPRFATLLRRMNIPQ
jgi:TolB-like protein/DNA-binding winged helix-turn-helix (wHTH) protein